MSRVSLIGAAIIGVAVLAQGPAALAQSAAPLPDPFVGRGNEPFWSVEIGGGQLSVTRPGTKGVETYPLPDPQEDSATGGQRYSVPGGPTVTLRASLCRDSATGMPYPYTVSFEDEGVSGSGCGGDPRALLSGGPWTVVTIGGNAVVSTEPPTLSFGEDGSLSGSTGCNRYSGRATLTGEALSVSPLAVTRMACPETAMATERTFLEAIGQVDRFDIDEDGSLVLIGADAPLMVGRR